MILIGLGGNLASRFGPPRETLRAALDAMAGLGVEVLQISPWYESAPVPASDQPWYVNGVAVIDTPLAPRDLLKALQEIEEAFGRVRTVRNAARIIDLDILDYDGLIADEADLKLPHPRLQVRAFVLLPLREVAPDWRHPISGEDIDTLIAKLPPEQQVRRTSAD